MAELKALMARTLANGEVEKHGYDIYPAALDGLYDERRRAIGEALYGNLGIRTIRRTGRGAIERLPASGYPYTIDPVSAP